MYDDDTPRVRVPNVARVYDFLLGGNDNFGVDRDAADRILNLIPDAMRAAGQNRLFVSRAVRYLAGQGVRQFIDIGTGFPVGRGVLVKGFDSIYDAAKAASDPGCRVVYTDVDRVAVGHAMALMTGNNPDVTAIVADMRIPRTVLGSAELRRVIDFDEPVALIMTAVAHYVDDRADPYGSVNALKTALAPGSYLVLSHMTADNLPGEVVRRVQQVLSGAATVTPRSHAAIERFFDGYRLLEPGLVNVDTWHTEVVPQMRALLYGGVAVKPDNDPPAGASAESSEWFATSTA